MKTCIQRGAAPVAASSSSVQTEPWLRQKAVPAARRGARAAALAVRPEQPGKAGRPDHDRQAQPLAEQLDRQVALGRARSGLRQQLDVVEGGFVAPERPLVLRAAVGEIEDRPRQGALAPAARIAAML